jgi:hypothetical protein
LSKGVIEYLCIIGITWAFSGVGAQEKITESSFAYLFVLISCDLVTRAVFVGSASSTCPPPFSKLGLNQLLKFLLLVITCFPLNKKGKKKKLC